MSCKDCLNRRDFLAKSALAAAALVAADGCGDGQIGPTAASLGSGLTIKLADFPGLATPGTVVDVGHVRAVVRTGDTTFLGLSRVCTHGGAEARRRGQSDSLSLPPFRLLSDRQRHSRAGHRRDDRSAKHGRRRLRRGGWDAYDQLTPCIYRFASSLSRAQ